MATVSPTAGSATAGGAVSLTTGGASSSGKEIAGNFQDFLLLLTTQLKNQSPLDPLDTNQFTQQLVSFAGVEQQLRSNDTLSAILAAQKSSSISSAAGYVGLSVTADGATTALAGGSAKWSLNAAKAAAKATFTIKSVDGTIVSTKTQPIPAGAGTFTWDGRDKTGNAMPDGRYTIAIAATDAAGQPVSVSTDVAGTVSAVDVSGAAPILTVGTAKVPLADIRTVGGS